jgi:hypothetical protein
MIYVEALRMFWPVFLLLGFAAITVEILGYKTAARCLVGGLLGSVVGYVFAPLIGTLFGSVPGVMIEPQYFTQPFRGCIAPSALFLACMTSISGVLLGFFAGSYIGFRGRPHA